MTSSSKEDKPHSRSRRHSGIVVVHQGKKSKKHKKDKDSDSSSVTSSNSSDTIVVPPAPKCPLRFMLAGLVETEGGPDDKSRGCPLRKVQLWHTIPLCLLAIINLLLVIVALLGVAGYRIAMGIQAFVVTLAKSDLNYSPYAEHNAEHNAESDTGSTLSEGKT